MITEAEIQKVDFNSNSCTVRIPLFETVNTPQAIILDAKIAAIPGIVNGYKAGDIVWVAFENGHPETPIVISRVYSSFENEQANGGAVYCHNLQVEQNATIPNTTKITDVEASYNTLNKVVNSLKNIYTFLGIDPTSKDTAKANGRYCVTIIGNSAGEGTELVVLHLFTCAEYASMDDFIETLVTQGFTSIDKLYTAVGNCSTDYAIGVYVNNKQLVLVYAGPSATEVSSKFITEITKFTCADISNI